MGSGAPSRGQWALNQEQVPRCHCLPGARGRGGGPAVVPVGAASTLLLGGGTASPRGLGNQGGQVFPGQEPVVSLKSPHSSSPSVTPAYSFLGTPPCTYYQLPW